MTEAMTPSETSITERLSEAQRALLIETPCSCSFAYAPAKKLVSLGLAEFREGRYADYLCPTDEGLAVQSLISKGS